jgi:hypothetical protein
MLWGCEYERAYGLISFVFVHGAVSFILLIAYFMGIWLGRILKFLNGQKGLYTIGMLIDVVCEMLNFRDDRKYEVFNNIICRKEINFTHSV